MFAAINNGQLAKKIYITQPRKKVCESVLILLWTEGFILGYKISRLNPNKLKIYLKYYKNTPVIKSIKPVSKPGQRVYYSLKQIWKIDSNDTFLIISTNLGIKSILDCKQLRIGGEPLVIVN